MSVAPENPAPGEPVTFYLEIFQRERRRLAGPILEEVSAAEDTEEAVSTLMTRAAEAVEENPLLYRAFFDDDIKNLLRGASDEKVEETVVQGFDIVVPLFEEWQSTGDLREEDPELLAYVFRTVFVGLFESRDFFGEAYPAVRDLTIDVVANGLVSADRDG